MGVTITDIADRAGVSKATVSAVLNEKSTVGSETRARVQEVMRALNYQPRGEARLLRSERSRLLGLIVKEVENPFYAEVAGGAHAWATAEGYDLVVLNSRGDPEEEVRLVSVIRALGAAGVVISPALNPNSDLTYISELKRSGFPFVLLENVGDYQIRCNLVDIDNVAAAQSAVAHLIGLGHTRIFHLAGPSYSAHTRERIDGVRRAFAESSLVFRHDLIVPTGSRAEDGYREAQALLAKPWDGPIGITCYNDLVALGVWRAVREKGLRIPEDVSIVGYDDLSLLDYLPFGLTTVHAPNRDMGGEAIGILVRHLAAEEPPALERITLETYLVDRGSTCAVGVPGPEPALAH